MSAIEDSYVDYSTTIRYPLEKLQNECFLEQRFLLCTVPERQKCKIRMGMLGYHSRLLTSLPYVEICLCGQRMNRKPQIEALLTRHSNPARSVAFEAEIPRVYPSHLVGLGAEELLRAVRYHFALAF